MPVKIRLARRGRKKKAIYDIVVADSRSPRDGKFIEKLGVYNPNTNPASITLSDDKALDWVLKGAQPTDTARAILSYKGIMMKKHLQIGVLKGALSQEDADTKYNEWLNSKDAQIQGKVDKLAQAKAVKAKAALDAEAKKNQARLDALLAKKKEEEAALAAEVAAASTSEAETAIVEEAEEAVAEAAPVVEEVPAVEEAVVEEPAKEEAPVEVKAEEAPVVEETPAEVKTEAPAEVKAEEAPATEAKAEEAPEASSEEEKKAE